MSYKKTIIIAIFYTFVVIVLAVGFVSAIGVILTAEFVPATDVVFMNIVVFVAGFVSVIRRRCYQG